MIIKVYRISMEWTVDVPDEDDPHKATKIAHQRVTSGQVPPDSKVTTKFLTAPQYDPNRPQQLTTSTLMKQLIALDPHDRRVIADRLGITLSDLKGEQTKSHVIAVIIAHAQSTARLPQLAQEIRKRLLHYKRVVGEADTIKAIAETGQTKRVADILATCQSTGLLTDQELTDIVEKFDKRPEEASKSKLLAMIIGRATEHPKDILVPLLERLQATHDDKPVPPPELPSTDELQERAGMHMDVIRDRQGKPIELCGSRTSRLEPRSKLTECYEGRHDACPSDDVIIACECECHDDDGPGSIQGGSQASGSQEQRVNRENDGPKERGTRDS